ncbi:hypothetical protein AB0E77_27855 [Streptomyces sp. NPDC032940]|uniref:hypothetical protein n=1 Tax=Streptomyces sp. NPDC032940 TaxID=3155366 RepID=UPI003402A87F
MTDHRLEGPGENGTPVPRDLPDQQAGAGEDPWEAAATRARPAPAAAEDAEDSEDSPDPGAADRDAPADAEGTDVPDADTDVPDTDEAGTGRRGAPQSGNVHPEHPVPDESSG